MNIIEKARQLRKVIEQLSIFLEDDKALENTELFPIWEVNKSYSPGDRVRYNNTLYKCLIQHIGQESWNPVAAPSLWAIVLIPNPDVIPEWIQPDSTNPYMQGDKVKHMEKIWISNIDNNVWEPGIYGWTEDI